MAFSGEILSTIRFWIDLLALSQLSSHFLSMLKSNAEIEASEKSHLKSMQELA